MAETINGFRRNCGGKAYKTYDDKWIKAYFDWKGGGYNVYHKKHLFSSASRGGEAEKTVGKLLAKNEGKQIEFLQEGGKKKPDWLFDKQTWDIKKITISTIKVKVNGYQQYLLRRN